MKSGKISFGMACENPVGLFMYGDHMKTVQYTWVNT